MIVTDPIADMLTRIRNAQTARHETVIIPDSKMKKAIAEILLAEGYISSVEYIEDKIQGKINEAIDTFNKCLLLNPKHEDSIKEIAILSK